MKFPGALFVQAPVAWDASNVAMLDTSCTLLSWLNALWGRRFQDRSSQTLMLISWSVCRQGGGCRWETDRYWCWAQWWGRNAARTEVLLVACLKNRDHINEDVTERHLNDLWVQPQMLISLVGKWTAVLSLFFSPLYGYPASGISKYKWREEEK